MLRVFCGFFRMIFNTGIENQARQDYHTAQHVYGTGNLVKQESGQDGGNHRLAQLGGGYKGGRKVFQAPAEDTVSQNRGKDGQQRPTMTALEP